MSAADDRAEDEAWGMPCGFFANERLASAERARIRRAEAALRAPSAGCLFCRGAGRVPVLDVTLPSPLSGPLGDCPRCGGAAPAERAWYRRYPRGRGSERGTLKCY